MKSFFISTSSGQLLSSLHIESLDVQGSGVAEELRHEVQALTASKEHHVLATFKGPDSHLQAERFMAELLERGEVETLNPRATPESNSRFR